MKSILFIAVLLLSSQTAHSLSVQKIYNALNGNDENVLKNQITWVQKYAPAEMKNAYLGALYMKQASFQWTPWSKWDYFSKGKNLLENEIQSNKTNVEMRFLRLMVQENAPSIVGYSDNVKADAKLIMEQFSKQTAELQKIIKGYAKQSDALKSLK